MNKQQALERAMELLGIADVNELQLYAYQAPEANRFRYIAKESRGRKDVVVEVTRPASLSESKGWKVRKL